MTQLNELEAQLKEKLIQKPILYNYTKGRQGYNPDFIVYHTIVGYQDNVAPWFNNPNSKVSSHFLVRLDGTIEQYVDIYDTAWHAGDWITNLRSVGIEHADQNNPYDSVRTKELYNSSALLSAYIIRLRGWYIFPNIEDFVRSHFFVKHKDVKGVSTACPAGLDVEKIKRLTFEILSKPEVVVIPTPKEETTQETPEEKKEETTQETSNKKKIEPCVPVCECQKLKESNQSETIKNLLFKLLKLVISRLFK